MRRPFDTFKNESQFFFAPRALPSAAPQNIAKIRIHRAPGKTRVPGESKADMLQTHLDYKVPFA